MDELSWVTDFATSGVECPKADQGQAIAPMHAGAALSRAHTEWDWLLPAHAHSHGPTESRTPVGRLPIGCEYGPSKIDCALCRTHYRVNLAENLVTPSLQKYQIDLIWLTSYNAYP